MKENVLELILTIWWWQICSLTELMPVNFSFPMCLQRCSKSEEGTENSLLLSYFSVFAISKPKSYITPNFKKSNQNLMLPKYLKKMKENIPEPVLMTWWWQICSLTLLMPIYFSFPMCLQRCFKSKEGTENSPLLSYFSVFALSKPKSYITPNFKKSNQNLMLPKYLN